MSAKQVTGFAFRRKSMKTTEVLHTMYGMTLAAVLGLAALSAYSQGSSSGARSAAGGYPVKPVRIVDAFPPGGGSDVVARLIAPKLTEAWGQQVLVENRGGAGGTIGAEHALRAAPDGYTVLIATASYAVNPSVYKLPYDPINDITVIGQTASGPFVAVVHPSVPVKSIKELVALAKAKPGAINFASTGTGGITHLVSEFFKLTAGVDLVHIPYKGTGPALTDLLGGQVQVMFAASAAVMPHVTSAKLRALAVTGAKRVAALPDLPTVIESGVPGYDATLWYALLAPRGLPKDVLNLWNTEVNRVIQTQEIRERFASGGLEPAPGSPEQFTAVLKRDVERWAKVVKQAGIKIE
jgi:tripartite-type tricarboxylate transporter receptor subunit TctC